jgi:hypothetical protein
VVGKDGIIVMYLVDIGVALATIIVAKATPTQIVISGKLF